MPFMLSFSGWVRHRMAMQTHPSDGHVTSSNVKWEVVKTQYLVLFLFSHTYIVCLCRSSQRWWKSGLVFHIQAEIGERQL